MASGWPFQKAKKQNRISPITSDVEHTKHMRRCLLSFTIASVAASNANSTRSLGTTKSCGCQQFTGSSSPQQQGAGSDGQQDVSVRDMLIAKQAKSIMMPRPQRGSGIGALLEYNKTWSDGVEQHDPSYFPQLALQQTPQYLWIGCADSRVPANQVVGLAPGEVFVHRNIANVVSHSDLNCLSCLQFAVEVLKVEHVIICGHYGCGGVNAALSDARVGLADNWIMHVGDVKNRYLDRLESIPVDNRLDALCELNVITQLSNIVDTHIMRDWWACDTTHRVDVHGWCYGLKNGRVNPLLSIAPTSDIRKEIAEAVERTFKKYAMPF